jgi:hypothetical protein
MTDKDTLEALRKLGREIRLHYNATICLPVYIGGITKAYNDLWEAITGEEHRWTR